MAQGLQLTQEMRLTLANNCAAGLTWWITPARELTLR